jgi:hypothetical protein
MSMVRGAKMPRLAMLVTVAYSVIVAVSMLLLVTVLVANLVEVTTVVDMTVVKTVVVDVRPTMLVEVTVTGTVTSLGGTGRVEDDTAGVGPVTNVTSCLFSRSGLSSRAWARVAGRNEVVAARTSSPALRGQERIAIGSVGGGEENSRRGSGRRAGVGGR